MEVWREGGRMVRERAYSGHANVHMNWNDNTQGKVNWEVEH
jgi:hypothetical protein